MSPTEQPDVDLDRPLAPDAEPRPHSASGEGTAERDLAELAPPARSARRWTPKRVVVTPAALDEPHGQRIVARVEALGIEVERLTANRLTGVRGETDRETYARAKSTLAVVVSPPSKRRLQPISPSADWRVDLAEGCPAHCQYCYLAGSLSGPPVTRVYADLDDILANLTSYAGTGEVTSRSAARRHEGTTFEASCYSDPLALDHLTGSWQRAVEHFGAWDAPVQLRWTTKFADVDRFVALDHRGRTRVRFSVNCLPVTRRWEGGTSTLEQRLDAVRRLALADYPVGLTIAPIMPLEDWRDHYGELLELVGRAVDDVADLDLTAELITHRFTAGSKEVLTGWYPRTTLEMDEARRSVKRGKFGTTKHVYPREVMAELRGWFTTALAERVPACRVLYWT
ncbi:SPL family radical SAM protein [Nocardioides aurantiacus]|uniref:Spore photoproduct lyase n=1 Tax=Nocardioides aurantiacus TaxID=86796 RepID=A0A3N2CTF7_9ACTN|nr:radical SAM protein [Nocardioides aurantiacus]ROR90819.1 spore photoproduct lyase [Nocardioides aurantiacus]